VYQALEKTTDFLALQQLGQGVSAVASHLEPKDAGKAAAILRQATSKPAEPPSGEYFSSANGTVVLMPTKRTAEVLSAILCREDAERFGQRRRGGGGAVGMLTCPEALLVAPALLQPALEPLAPPLPAQTLVDLLKHPFCVGEARHRTVPCEETPERDPGLAPGQRPRDYSPRRCLSPRWLALPHKPEAPAGKKVIPALALRACVKERHSKPPHNSWPFGKLAGQVLVLQQLSCLPPRRVVGKTRAPE
jgi:hypothetical protein